MKEMHTLVMMAFRKHVSSIDGEIDILSNQFEAIYSGGVSIICNI